MYKPDTKLHEVLLEKIKVCVDSDCVQKECRSPVSLLFLEEVDAHIKFAVAVYFEKRALLCLQVVE